MVERLERSLYAFTRHAGSPDDGRAAVAANRLIFDQPAKHSNIYRERLAAGSTIHGQPELRSSSGARPGDRASWRESQAHGVSARRLRGQKITRAAQQLRSPTGRPRPVARKPSSRSERPAIEGQKRDSLSRGSKINGGGLGNRFQNLWWSVWKEVFYAFTRHAGSPDDGRAAVAANRLIFDQPAKHSTIYRERLAAGSHHLWSQSCAAAQEPDRATAPRGAKAKLTE